MSIRPGRGRLPPLDDDRVSALIGDLYREAGDHPPESFKGWALARLQALLPFDAASWRGNGVDGGLGEVRGNGPLLSLVNRDHLTTLEQALTLRRGSRKRPFSVAERECLELLFPHLIESAGQNLVHALRGGGCATAGGLGAGAVCDGDGYLHQASPAFTALLLRERPQWQGPLLPWPMGLEEDGFLIRGDRIMVHGLPRENLIHLRARLRTPLDALTPAELRVARALAHGTSYKAAARELGLSPSTVNNHAARLYLKLGVANKGELATLWPQLEELAGGLPQG